MNFILKLSLLFVFLFFGLNSFGQSSTYENWTLYMVDLLGSSKYDVRKSTEEGGIKVINNNMWNTNSGLSIFFDDNGKCEKVFFFTNSEGQSNILDYCNYLVQSGKSIGSGSNTLNLNLPYNYFILKRYSTNKFKIYNQYSDEIVGIIKVELQTKNGTYIIGVSKL